MAGTLQDKVALVTGGGSGIGQSTSLLFAREGAKVVVSDVNAQGGEETVSQINDAGGDATFLYSDVSKSSDVREMVDRIVDVYGRLDFGINNAGIGGGRGLTHEHTEEIWDLTTSINLKGVWLCMKYEIIQMLKQGSGAIVNVSSGGGLVGVRNCAAYTAAKHGVNGLTKTAALEYAQKGIRVNSVCPGVIQTPLLEEGNLRHPERVAQYLAAEPIGRLGMPEEVAEAVVWLCSDAASFVTGHTMSVDGGYTAQ